MVVGGSLSTVLVLTAAGVVASAVGRGAGGSERATRAAELRGPVEGGLRGFPFTSSALGLEGAGYREDGEWGIDGRWDVAPAATAPYTTRILVRRPTDPDRFNGTVVVEWLNMSAGVDIDVDFGYLGQELLREGYAIADGESQSALRMLTYGNAIHPIAKVYDGFLIHSRKGGSPPLADGFLGVDVAQVRDDLDERSSRWSTRSPTHR